VLDFTSVLYLGLRHRRDALPPWAQLTTGVPLTLHEPPLARQVARELARLTGCERATLAPSTLHTFWDLFGMLAMTNTEIHLDAGAYPTAVWGVERAAAQGVPTGRFPHHDSVALRRRLERAAQRGHRPVVVTDGVCPGCATSAPLGAYLALVRRFGGCLVVDDTQALGILGEHPGPAHPYGHDGGGSLRAGSLRGPDVLLVASLAKGFGVPLAVLAGEADALSRFEACSGTRMHASPPSFAHLHAAQRALALNRADGDRLRLSLAGLVGRFRCRLGALGLRPHGGLFPVQTLSPMSKRDAAALHRRLLRLGVRAVLHQARCGRGAGVSFLITTLHSPVAIDRAAEVLGQAVRLAASPAAPEVTHVVPSGRDRGPGLSAIRA
jgi:8-amino-7-oxononanoate synthase